MKNQKATLADLLTVEEYEYLRKQNVFEICLDRQITHLTVTDLSNIAFVLIRTEHGQKCPQCILSAESIRILTERAIEKRLEIF